jgi:glucose-6-phosphate 1-dehydrogenase
MTTAPACTIALFGAVGDLTKTLLLPALYNLASLELLDKNTKVIGLDHNDRNAQSWGKEMREALETFAKAHGKDAKPGTLDPKAAEFVLGGLDYIRFDFENDDDYRALAERLNNAGNIIFYLAVSPRFFENIVAGLGKAGLLKEEDGAFRRVVVEKPFGRDLATARELNAKLTSLANESQLFRIDHFLGKETVQGIPALRFASGLFEPLFNRDAIESVQITAAETIGVNHRGAFYETTGALRDMVPNHLFSLLTLVAMDAPSSMDATAMRDAKAALLGAIEPIGPGDAARGQYAAGTVEGKPAPAYREEARVAPDSTTETYAALTVKIANDRWRGVPFYLRTGKRMSAHVTTIALMLRPSRGPIATDPARPDMLLLGIDPHGGLVQRFAAKRPGVELELGRASMGFRYDETFDEPPNVGYETLLYRVMLGDAQLFQRADMIEAEWAAVVPVLDAWDASHEAPEFYHPGSEGPACADDLLAKNGHAWLPVAPLQTLGVEPPAKPAVLAGASG